MVNVYFSLFTVFISVSDLIVVGPFTFDKHAHQEMFGLVYVRNQTF